MLLAGCLVLLAGRDHLPHELGEVDVAAGTLRLPLQLLLDRRLVLLLAGRNHPSRELREVDAAAGALRLPLLLLLVD